MKLAGALAVSLAIHAALGLLVARWRASLMEEALAEPLPVVVVDEPPPPLLPPAPVPARASAPAPAPAARAPRAAVREGVAGARAPAPSEVAPEPPAKEAVPPPPLSGGPDRAGSPDGSSGGTGGEPGTGATGTGMGTGATSGGAAGAGAGPARVGDGLGDALRRLEAAVRARAARDYPALARRRGLEGTVELRFRLRPDGGVVGLEVVRSAGPVLDEAARAAVLAAAPLPYYPAPVTLPIRYRLRPAE